MYLMYAFVLGAAIHNIVRYLYKQHRYKFFHIAYFYVLVIAISFMRLTWFSLIFYITVTYSTESAYKNDQLNSAVFYTDVTATYLELLLGL